MKTQPNLEVDCCHHWLLGQPTAGAVTGVCRICGAERCFPAALAEPSGEDEVDRPLFGESLQATAAGGARPSPDTLLVDSES